MQRAIKWVCAVAVVVVSYFGTLWIIDRYLWLPCPQGERFPLAKPFLEKSKFSYFSAAPALRDVADKPGAINRSPYMVCEDNFVLGPAHSDLGDISGKGMGRFSHWIDGFRFSASDNSDPNMNGRAYSAVLPN